MLEHFQQMYVGKTFFLHWDEVGCIEGDLCTHLFKGPASDLQSSMQTYYCLWELFVRLLCAEGVYMFITCKNPAFALIGLGCVKDMVSPTLWKQLVIGGLKPCDIVQTFQLSTISTGSLVQEYVKIDSSLLD